MKDAKQRNLAVYCLLALAVLLPLLKPGYILSLDMVFTPKIPWPAYLSASYPFWGVLHVVNFFVAGQIIEKLLLFGILVAAGFGAHRLVEKLKPTPDGLPLRWAAYFAGVMYMFNPFVYSRFMAGQFAVLLGYALLPFFVVTLWQFCEAPARSRALLLALWTVAIAAVSIYAVLPLAIVAVAVGGLFAWRKRGDIKWRKGFIKWGAITLAVSLALNGYWLLPMIFGSGQTAHIIDGFTQSDLRAFATNGRGFGLIGNVFGLQGFWADSKNLFLVPQDVFGWWRVPIILWWLLLAYGVAVGLRRRRGAALTFLAVVLVGAGLAIGSAGTFVAPVNRWLAFHVPFFVGYREPQKFEVLIALAYIFFSAVAVGSLVQKLLAYKPAKQHAQTAAFVLCLVPVFCAPLMPWGFHGQLHATEYPVEWNAINDRLSDECTGNCRVLFLPWHLYMRYGFAGRIVADPASKFFNSQIVASNDPELKGASPYSLSAAQKAVAATILPHAAHGGKTMGAALRPYGIHYVLLAKEDDYKQYAYLNRQKDLQVVLDTPTLKLYEITSHE